MDNPVFDAMLKTALEEALRRDIEEAPEVSAPSRRQRKRMRRLLAEPFSNAETARKPRNPARFLAAAVIAALLTGAAAAGLALGGGERFRQMFEEETWAAGYYKGAADTEQLLGLGTEMDTVLVESAGLRLEMLDAIFDGQLAMAEVRMTLLDPALSGRLQEDGFHFGETEILLEDGRSVGSWGYSCASWETEEELEEGQYSLIFSVSDEALSAGGRCGICLRDLLCGFGEKQETLLAGEWTLSITLRPTEVLHLEPEAVCRVNGVDWILDGVTLSPLALGLTFHREDEGGRYSDWSPCRDLAIRLKSGEVLELKGTTGVGASDTQVEARVEFLVPLNLERVESLRVCGAEIPLRG